MTFGKGLAVVPVTAAQSTAGIFFAFLAARTTVHVSKAVGVACSAIYQDRFDFVVNHDLGSGV